MDTLYRKYKWFVCFEKIKLKFKALGKIKQIYKISDWIQ